MDNGGYEVRPELCPLGKLLLLLLAPKKCSCSLVHNLFVFRNRIPSQLLPCGGRTAFSKICAAEILCFLNQHVYFSQANLDMIHGAGKVNGIYVECVFAMAKYRN